MKRIVILTSSLAGRGNGVSIALKLQSKLLVKKINHQMFIDDWPESVDDFSDCFLVGGDGTFNYFLNRYKCCHVPVTLFKGGSGNDFFEHISGRKSLDECFEAGLNDETKYVDLGICNNQLFINGVGIGFDGQVVYSMRSGNKIFKGKFSYAFSVLRELIRYSGVSLKVETTDESVEGIFFMISIANGSQYGGGFKVSPESVVQDRLLNLVQIKSISIGKRLRYLPYMLMGKHLKLSFVKAGNVKSMTISSSANLNAHLDGELIQDNRFIISVYPEQLKMKY